MFELIQLEIQPRSRGRDRRDHLIPSGECSLFLDQGFPGPSKSSRSVNLNTELDWFLMTVINDLFGFTHSRGQDNGPIFKVIVLFVGLGLCLCLHQPIQLGFF